MHFIFPEILRLMHPCYLGRMGAPVHTIYLHDLLHFKMPTFCKHSPLLENIQNTNSFVFIAMIV